MRKIFIIFLIILTFLIACEDNDTNENNNEINIEGIYKCIEVLYSDFNKDDILMFNNGYLEHIKIDGSSGLLDNSTYMIYGNKIKIENEFCILNDIDYTINYSLEGNKLTLYQIRDNYLFFYAVFEKIIKLQDYKNVL
jgi:hypothetical protein